MSMNTKSVKTNPVIRFFSGMSSVTQILIGLILGILLAWVSPETARKTEVLGDLFIRAMRAVAPVLVLILVAASIANHEPGQKTNMRPVLFLYLLGTFLAGLLAVIASFAFPSVIELSLDKVSKAPPEGILAVLKSLLVSVVDNPVSALMNANFIGLLTWAIGLGLALRTAKKSTKEVLGDIAHAVSYVVRVVIQFAPLGIFGLVSSQLATTGFSALEKYAHLLLVLIGCMLVMAFVVNPLIVFWKLRTNPYPLVLTCLRDSGITAFFTRSSAANIPVNLDLCRRLGLPEETYAISIPLGATINMEGAAITISVLTLAAANTLGISVDIPTAIILSVVSALCACGASGVAGGSLLLIPVACGLFGIGGDLAMQVVAVGFIVSFLQDSAETALNSSTDVLFTAVACRAEENKMQRAQQVGAARSS